MDRFEDLRTFVAVIDAGGVTAAAAALDRAPSAVSRRVKELERRLGVQLLVRTTRTLAPTAAGERFLERARRLLAELDEAEAEAAADTRALSGRLVVTAPLSFGLAHLCPAIHAFLASHPALLVDLDLSDRVVDLVAARVDVALRIGSLSDSRLRARRLARISQIVAASPRWWDEHGRVDTPEALAGRDALCYSNLDQPSRWDWSDDGNGERGSVVVRPRLLASNGDALVKAAVAGLGVVRLPSFIVSDAIDAGALEPALLDRRWGDIALHALYPDTRFLPARTRAFVDAMVEAFPEEPPWERCLRRYRDGNRPGR